MKTATLVLALFATAALSNPPITPKQGGWQRVVEKLAWFGVGTVFVGGAWLYTIKQPPEAVVEQPAEEVKLSIDGQRAVDTAEAVIGMSVGEQLEYILGQYDLSEEQLRQLRSDLIAVYWLWNERR